MVIVNYHVTHISHSLKKNKKRHRRRSRAKSDVRRRRSSDIHVCSTNDNIPLLQSSDGYSSSEERMLYNRGISDAAMLEDGLEIGSVEQITKKSHPQRESLMLDPSPSKLIDKMRRSSSGKSEHSSSSEIITANSYETMPMSPNTEYDLGEDCQAMTSSAQETTSPHKSHQSRKNIDKPEYMKPERTSMKDSLIEKRYTDEIPLVQEGKIALTSHKNQFDPVRRVKQQQHDDHYPEHVDAVEVHVDSPIHSSSSFEENRYNYHLSSQDKRSIPDRNRHRSEEVKGLREKSPDAKRGRHKSIDSFGSIRTLNVDHLKAEANRRKSIKRIKSTRSMAQQAEKAHQVDLKEEQQRINNRDKKISKPKVKASRTKEVPNVKSKDVKKPTNSKPAEHEYNLPKSKTVILNNPMFSSEYLQYIADADQDLKQISEDLLIIREYEKMLNDLGSDEVSDEEFLLKYETSKTDMTTQLNKDDNLCSDLGEFQKIEKMLLDMESKARTKKNSLVEQAKESFLVDEDVSGLREFRESEKFEMVSRSLSEMHIEVVPDTPTPRGEPCYEPVSEIAKEDEQISLPKNKHKAIKPDAKKQEVKSPRSRKMDQKESPRQSNNKKTDSPTRPSVPSPRKVDVVSMNKERQSPRLRVGSEKSKEETRKPPTLPPKPQFQEMSEKRNDPATSKDHPDPLKVSQPNQEQSDKEPSGQQFFKSAKEMFVQLSPKAFRKADKSSDTKASSEYYNSRFTSPRKTEQCSTVSPAGPRGVIPIPSELKSAETQITSIGSSKTVDACSQWSSQESLLRTYSTAGRNKNPYLDMVHLRRYLSDHARSSESLRREIDEHLVVKKKSFQSVRSKISSVFKKYGNGSSSTSRGLLGPPPKRKHINLDTGELMSATGSSEYMLSSGYSGTTFRQTSCEDCGGPAVVADLAGDNLDMEVLVRLVESAHILTEDEGSVKKPYSSDTNLKKKKGPYNECGPVTKPKKQEQKCKPRSTPSKDQGLPPRTQDCLTVDDACTVLQSSPQKTKAEIKKRSRKRSPQRKPKKNIVKLCPCCKSCKDLADHSRWEDVPSNSIHSSDCQYHWERDLKHNK